jgi:hypothetical protein
MKGNRPVQFLDRFGHLLAFLAVVLVALLAWKLGAPPMITGPLGLVLTGLVVQAARNSDPPSGPTPPAAVALIAPFCWLAGFCALVVLLPGCAGSFEESRGSVRMGVSPELVQRCASLDDAHRNWGAVAKGTGVLAGGLAAAEALPAIGEKGRLALAGGALASGAVAAFSVFEAEGAATSWSRECAK